MRKEHLMLKKKIVALFIMTLMVVTLIPATVFAEDPSVTLDEENSEINPKLKYEYDSDSQKYIPPEDGKNYYLRFDEHGESLDGKDHNVTVVSSNPAVVKIDRCGYLYAVYSAQKSGTATITYTGNNGASIEVPITVTRAPYDVKFETYIRNPDSTLYPEDWIESNEAVFGVFIDERDAECKVWIEGGRLDGKKLTFDGDALVDLVAEDNLFIDDDFTIVPRDTAGDTVLVGKDLDGKEVRLPIHISQEYLDARDAYYAQQQNKHYIEDLADSEYECEDFFVGEDTLDLQIPFKSYNDYSDYPISQKAFSALNVTISIAGETYKATIKPDPYNKGDYIATFNFHKTFALGTAFLIKYELNGESATVKDVVKKEISPKITIKNLTYNGKNRKPSISVKYGSNSLVYGKDYTYELDKATVKNVGVYYVGIVPADNSKYVFYEEKSFRINPKGTILKKLTKGKKSFTATWNKQATQTTGYQIQYGLKRSFKDAKTYTVTKNRNTKATIKRLKAGKTYYVRIRTYKTIGKTKYYSGWSKAKTIKTK